MKTPMHSNTSQGLGKKYKSVDATTYRQMIGSLLYLTASRLDIMFSVCLCAWFQYDPREVYLSVTKRIFRYLKGITNLRLCYKKRESYSLQRYCGANFASDKIERQSTSEGFHFIGGDLVS